MKLGYHSNGLIKHKPLEAIELLAQCGYTSVGLSVDQGLLNPYQADHKTQLHEIKSALKSYAMSSTIEANPYFLLDPRSKCEPSLLDPVPGRVDQRVDFYRHCIDLAAELESDCVTISSGYARPGLAFHDGLDRLVAQLDSVLKYAEEKEVYIGFEPIPDMLIDTVGRFERLYHLIESPRLKLTLDIGHLFCKSEVPIAGFIEKWANAIVNVHIEDMVAGDERHVMFGDGQIYFPPIIQALKDIGYQNGIHVELEEHCFDGAAAVRKAYDFLSPILREVSADSKR